MVHGLKKDRVMLSNISNDLKKRVGLSGREIAEILQVNRETIRKILKG